MPDSFPDNIASNYGDNTLSREKVCLHADSIAFKIRNISDRIPKFGLDDYSDDAVHGRLEWLEQALNKKLEYIRGRKVPNKKWEGNIENLIGVAQFPLAIMGPILINGQYANGKYYVPFATTEGAITTVYNTGMKIINECGGVDVHVQENNLHITPAFHTKTIDSSKNLKLWIENNFSEIKARAESTTRHGTLISISCIVAEQMLLTKFLFNTADAQGMNMINVATLAACEFIESQTGYKFTERSNYSAVKKISDHINMETFGKSAFAEARIPPSQLKKLRVTPRQMESLWRKGYLASMRSNMRGINCQVANCLAGIFLACGQDMADLTSSHVATSNCEVLENGDLYISLHIPSLLVGTVGGGTGTGTQKECLEIMDCYGSGRVMKFAEIIVAAALCGELVTGAALVTRKFVQGHALLGRNKPN